MNCFNTPCSQEKYSQGRTHGRMRCSGKIYWSKNQGPSPGACSEALPILLWKKSSLVLSNPEGPGPRILCPWFSPCQSLVPFSLCPHLATSVSVPSCALASAMLLYPDLHLERVFRPAWLLGPHSCHRERGHRKEQVMCVTKRPLLGFDCITLRFQTDQSLSQSFLGLCWALPLTRQSFPRLDTSFLCHHLGSYCTCLKEEGPPLVPPWLLLRMCPAEEFTTFSPS